MANQDIVSIQKRLKDLLPNKRYMHTLGVQYTAANLAMRYGCDIKEAQIAGLLHDCAKYMSDEKILHKCRKYQLPVTELEERNPYLLHGKLGAYLAEHEYGITSKKIQSAILYHTTGKPNMSQMEKIIFAADYMEPGRKMVPGLNDVRKEIYRNLDKAVVAILKNTLSYLKNENEKEIDPMTIRAYDYYKNL